MKSCKANFNFPFDGSKHATFKEVDLSRPVKYYDVHNVIKEMDLHQTVVLLGEAGCGKTYTGCRYMAQKYAEGYRVLFTTQSHKCLKNIASEFFTAIDELGISKKPEKSKILASFAKIGGIGGNSYIDTIPKRTIIYADECGLLDRKSFSALITLIKRGYHVIFAGDIKQDSVENFYVSLVAASTNYLELLGGTNDKYYEESLIYNAFGHYYDAFLRSQLKDLPIESFPYAIRLDTSPQPLQIRFDEGYEEVCLDKLPYYLDRINLFISAELCNKYARKLQLKRKQHLEDKGLRTSDMPCIWANVENKDDGDEETFGPIFPMQSFRIQENSNDRKHSYYCGDILRFLELDDKGNAICWNLSSRKSVILARSSFSRIKSAECYTLVDYQGNRTKKPVLVIARKGSLNATRLFSLNTRAEDKIQYVILLKKENDRILSIDEASKYLWSLHDQPRLQDTCDAFTASRIKNNFYAELDKIAANTCDKKLTDDDLLFLHLAQDICTPRLLKKGREKDKKTKEKITLFKATNMPTPESLPINAGSLNDTALIGIKKILRRNKILKEKLSEMTEVRCKNDCRAAHNASNYLANREDFSIQKIKTLCMQTIHRRENIRDIIDIIEAHPTWHSRVKYWRNVIAECIVNELDKRKKDKENSASKVFGEFLSLKYANTPNGRWNKLPYLASVCVNRKDLLSTLFGVDDIADYVENEILSKFDDPSFATSFRTCIKYFREIPESRPETIRRKLIKNSNNRNEIAIETTDNSFVESATTIAKTHLRLVDSDKKVFFSAGTNAETGKTYPINYGVSKRFTHNSSEFRQAKTMQEVLRQNDLYTENSADKRTYSHALNLKDSHLLVIDNDGDENVTKMIEDRSKELGVDVLREVCPTNPHKAHYFFSCNFSSNDDISCAFVHREDSKYKADVFLPTANHLIYRKDKVSMGKDLPCASEFSEVIRKLIQK